MAAVTRGKKRLGAYLATLRQTAGVDHIAVALELRISRVSVGRYENGQVLPPWTNLQHMLNMLGASVAEREQAVELWEVANDEPASVRLPTGAPKAYRTMVNAERIAPQVRSIATLTMPGLLQTTDYARALFDASHRFHRGEADAMTFIKSRLSRQELLHGHEPLTLHVIFDEAVLHREVGGPTVMREQLEHLLTVGDMPNVTLQAITFSAGAYGPMGGSCLIVDGPDPTEPPGVYLEYIVGGDWVDNEADARRFTAMFDDVSAAALSVADTVQLIRDQLSARGDQ